MTLKPELIDMMINDFPQLKLKGNHNTWVLKCPFHFDPRDRQQFFVDVKADNYHCIACGIRGKVNSLEEDMAKFRKKYGEPIKLDIHNLK